MGARRLTSSCRSTRLVAISASGAPTPTPAPLTSTSRRPKRSRWAATTRRMSSSSAMLPATCSTSCPAARSLCAASASFSGRRAATVSPYPSSPSAPAMASPIPLDAPVTMAARPGMAGIQPCRTEALWPARAVAAAERAVLGRSAVDQVVQALVDLGEDARALGVRELAVLDRLVEPRGLRGLQRRLQAVDRLALLLGDGGQRLAAALSVEELLLGHPEILGRGIEPAAEAPPGGPGPTEPRPRPAAPEARTAQQREPVGLRDPLLEPLGFVLREPSGRHRRVDPVGRGALDGRVELVARHVQAPGDIVEEGLLLGCGIGPVGGAAGLAWGRVGAAGPREDREARRADGELAPGGEGHAHEPTMRG